MRPLRLPFLWTSRDFSSFDYRAFSLSHCNFQDSLRSITAGIQDADKKVFAQEFLSALENGLLPLLNSTEARKIVIESSDTVDP